MLKKLFAAVLLLAITATANATLMRGINGQFDMFINANVNFNVDGSISELYFNNLLLAATPAKTIKNSVINDFFIPFEFEPFLAALTITKNPLIMANIAADVAADAADVAAGGVATRTSLWSFLGFEFFITEVASNKTDGDTTGLTIIGTLTHDNYEDTKSEYFISGQYLDVGLTNSKGFSATVTSPAPPSPPPPPVEVSAPGTLALFGLALVGFAASRRQKKSI